MGPPQLPGPAPGPDPAAGPSAPGRTLSSAPPWNLHPPWVSSAAPPASPLWSPLLPGASPAHYLLEPRPLEKAPVQGPTAPRVPPTLPCSTSVCFAVPPLPSAVWSRPTGRAHPEGTRAPGAECSDPVPRPSSRACWPPPAALTTRSLPISSSHPPPGPLECSGWGSSSAFLGVRPRPAACARAEPDRRPIPVLGPRPTAKQSRHRHLRATVATFSLQPAQTPVLLTLVVGFTGHLPLLEGRLFPCPLTPPRTSVPPSPSRCHPSKPHEPPAASPAATPPETPAR